MTTNAEKAALINRIALGCVFISHGLLKSVVYTLAESAQFFESLGIAGWLAYVVTFCEIIGGAALVLGIRTRWATVALLPVLLGTLWVHSGNGWLFTSPNGGWEYSAMLLVVSSVQILLGDGAFALAPERSRSLN
ncbi:MAG: DoxX family protein [Steroidobacteraceae bacterium]